MDDSRPARVRAKPPGSTYMVTSERSTRWNARAKMSYDVVKTGNLYRYDTAAPETFDNWWSSYGQTMLCDAGVLYAVEHGKPMSG